MKTEFTFYASRIVTNDQIIHVKLKTRNLIYISRLSHYQTYHLGSSSLQAVSRDSEAFRKRRLTFKNFGVRERDFNTNIQQH